MKVGYYLFIGFPEYKCFHFLIAFSVFIVFFKNSNDIMRRQYTHLPLFQCKREMCLW